MMSEKEIKVSSNPIIQKCFDILALDSTVISGDETVFFVERGGKRVFDVSQVKITVNGDDYYYSKKRNGMDFFDGIEVYNMCREEWLRGESKRFQKSLDYLTRVQTEAYIQDYAKKDLPDFHRRFDAIIKDFFKKKNSQGR